MLSLHLDSAMRAASPFAAVTERAHAADGTAAAPHEQGTFSAHLDLKLYDAAGHVRSVTDGAASLVRAKLAEGDAAVIEVQDDRGEITVTVRKDGTYAAVQHGAGGALRYDSRTGAGGNAALSALAGRAEQIASVASSAGTATALANAAPAALDAVAGPGGSTTDLTVTITDADGVSRYAGRGDGVAFASRTTGDVALETASIDHGALVDAVRRADGSGTTTITGGALGGAELTLTRERDGAEHVAVTNGGAGFGAAAAPLAAIDAFGDRITVRSDAQGRTTVDMVDAAGTAVTLRADQSGAAASLDVAVSVGGASGTERADVTEDATATTTTGSIARTGAALTAAAHDAKDGSADAGTLTFGIDQSIASLTTRANGITTTNDSAHLSAHAEASGSLDVAAKAGASAANGYRDLQGGGIAGAVEREATGAVSLRGAASRTILSLDAEADGQEKLFENDDPAKLSSTTNDDASVRVDVMGHREFGMRHDEVARNRDHAYFSSSELA